MEFDFSGKVILASGAASGMGLLACKKIVELGGNAVMADINEHALVSAVDEVNSIRPAKESEIISRLMHQLYLRGERESVTRRLALTNALLRAVPYYVLQCNISDEAALLSWNTMKKTESTH